MNIKVTKRSGKIVELNLEKWQAQIAKVCEGVSDVSQSMIEITSQPHFFDGITTREIDGLTLRAIVDLIDEEQSPETGHTNYQFVAGDVLIKKETIWQTLKVLDVDKLEGKQTTLHVLVFEDTKNKPSLNSLNKCI